LTCGRSEQTSYRRNKIEVRKSKEQANPDKQEKEELGPQTEAIAATKIIEHDIEVYGKYRNKDKDGEKTINYRTDAPGNLSFLYDSDSQGNEPDGNEIKQ
jgi:hypothetical protein